MKVFSLVLVAGLAAFTNAAAVANPEPAAALDEGLEKRCWGCMWPTRPNGDEG